MGALDHSQPAGRARAASAAEDMAGRLAPPGTWAVDPARSTVGWSVKHLGVSTVTGTFGAFAGELREDRAGGTVQAASLQTDDEQRDRFVRSDEFLDPGAFPELRLEAGVVAGRPPALEGELTIRDVTLPVTLTAERLRVTDDVVELDLRGTVKRRPYGLRFHQAMGAADRSVSDEVQIALDLVLVPVR